MADSNTRKAFVGNPPQTADDVAFVEGMRAPAEGNPVFTPWNQFSGMPTHNMADPGEGFQWDTFSPPNSPAFGATYPGMNAETEYLSQILNNIRNSPSSIDPDPRLADQSAPGGIYFPDASSEGHDLYLETLRNWSSTASVPSNYDPFNSPDLLQTQVSQESQQTSDKSSAKPSYSDIAKSLKSKPMKESKEKEEQNAKKKFPDPPPLKQPFRPMRKAHLPRQHSKGHKGNPDDMESKVTPDSKYGLDSFEDVDTSNGSIDKIKSESTESIPQLSRKESTSSVSSGTSGIEEIHLNKPPSFGKKDNSTKPKSSSVNNGPSETKTEKRTENNKTFFDPRRIFQSKSSQTTCASKEFSAGSSGTTILNNGKPAGPAKHATSNHRKSSDYINNDLRDDKKKSNQTSTKLESGACKKENVQNGKLDRKSRHNSTENHSTGRRRNRNQMVNEFYL